MTATPVHHVLALIAGGTLTGSKALRIDRLKAASRDVPQSFEPAGPSPQRPLVDKQATPIILSNRVEDGIVIESLPPS